MTVCTVTDCPKKHYCSGLCRMHYARLKKTGEIGGAATMRPLSKSRLAWIEAHKNYQGNDCLTWPFGRNAAGYGRFKLDGKGVYAHRVMCEAVNGMPPDFHEASHTCGRGNKGCVDPRHLVWKTEKENQRDRLRHGTSTRGENHGKTHLSDYDVLSIRGSRGLPITWLAQKYAITVHNIRAIQKRHSWAWL